MPPQARGRRGARISSQETLIDSRPSAASSGLQKPNLPRLAGTPASRRQYTYGSGVEPPPARPGRGLRTDQPVDLGNAVDKVLSRHEREDEDVSRRKMPPPARPDDMEEDELAGDSHASQADTPAVGKGGAPRRSQRRATDASSRGGSEDSFWDENLYDRRQFAPIGPKAKAKVKAKARQDQEDMRDDRSFGTESDYYGDATIVSSPRATPLISGGRSRRAAQPKPPSNLRNSKQPSLPTAPDELSSPPEVVKPREYLGIQPRDDETEPEEPQSEQRPSVPSDQEETRGERPSKAHKNPKPRTPKGSRLKDAPRKTPDILPKGRPLHHDNPTKNQQIEIQQATSSLLASRGISTPASFKVKPSRKPFLGLSQKRPEKALNPSFLSSHHSEADEELQKRIEESEAGGEQQDRSPWRDTWLRVKSFSPFRPSSRFEARVESIEVSDDETEEILAEHHTSLSVPGWWRFLYPTTYIDALMQLVDMLTDTITALLRTFIDFFRGPGPIRDSLMLLTAITVLIATTTAYVDMEDATSDIASAAGSFGSAVQPMVVAPVLGLQYLAGKIGDLTRSIHLPTMGTSDDLSDLWGLSDEDQKEFESFLKKYNHDFKILRDTGQLHEASLEKLQKVVPSIVRMELKDGKPVVTQEFWHAVRDLLRADDGFLKIEKHGGDYVVSPEHHWRAVAKRLAADPAFTSKMNLSLHGIEERMNIKMSSFWDGWVKDNDDKIASKLGSALEKLKAASSERELQDVVKKLVKEQLPEPEADGILVTRDEFLRHLKNEFAVHRSEIRAELDELQPRLNELIRESIKLASSKTAAPPSGMTRSDVTTLVNTLLRKALADANLEAMAKGKIHVHWDNELKNQVNYFNLGGGAVADPIRSSLTYDPFKKGVIADNAYTKGIRGAQPLPHSAALMPWFDEGDCWCAARQLNHRGNPHGAALSVLLGHQIVPQHVVIEHILPGATNDPGARPREIEVHARIEDVATRERLRDFAATHFPERDPSTEDWNATPADLGPKFVKIGQFVYEGAELHDGTHVHRLSSELLAMRAETDQVVVRATSDYGAENHTCFYRVRLYGHRLDVDDGIDL